MAQTSVAQFATSLNMPAGALLEQLHKAGVVKTKADDFLSEQDKSKLLEYLRRSHGDTEAKTKITLMRKETSEIRSQDSHGKSRMVQVEVRKKRVLVKRDTPDINPEVMLAPAAPLANAVAEQPVEPVVEKAVELVAEPVVAKTVEPVVEPVVAPVIEKPAEPVVEQVVEPVVLRGPAV